MLLPFGNHITSKRSSLGFGSHAAYKIVIRSIITESQFMSQSSKAKQVFAFICLFPAVLINTSSFPMLILSTFWKHHERKRLFWKGEAEKESAFTYLFITEGLGNMIYFGEAALGSILVFNVSDRLSIFIRIIHKGVLFKNAQRYLIK